MNPIDLNELRRLILGTQPDGVAPDDPARQVVVDQEGDMKRGSDLRPGEAYTRVPPETFAAIVSPPQPTARLARELAEVERYLPRGTRYIRLDNRDVWCFTKPTHAGVTFELAVYYEPDESPAGYCTRLLAPEIEGSWKNAHVGHIFSDGTICFGGSAPSSRCRRTLAEAFAKACVWAEGMAFMIRAREMGRPVQFPFSINNSPADVAG